MRAQGHISVVQERRFLLITNNGTGCQLTLAHDATVDIDALRQFAEAHTHVSVEYSGEPGLDSGVAHAVEPQGISQSASPDSADPRGHRS